MLSIDLDESDIEGIEPEEPSNPVEVITNATYLSGPDSVKPLEPKKLILFPQAVLHDPSDSAKDVPAARFKTPCNTRGNRRRRGRGNQAFSSGCSQQRFMLPQLAFDNGNNFPNHIWSKPPVQPEHNPGNLQTPTPLMSLNPGIPFMNAYNYLRNFYSEFQNQGSYYGSGIFDSSRNNGPWKPTSLSSMAQTSAHVKDPRLCVNSGSTIRKRPHPAIIPEPVQKSDETTLPAHVLAPLKSRYTNLKEDTPSFIPKPAQKIKTTPEKPVPTQTQLQTSPVKPTCSPVQSLNDQFSNRLLSYLQNQQNVSPGIEFLNSFLKKSCTPASTATLNGQIVESSVVNSSLDIKAVQQPLLKKCLLEKIESTQQLYETKELCSVAKTDPFNVNSSSSLTTVNDVYFQSTQKASSQASLETDWKVHVVGQPLAYSAVSPSQKKVSIFDCLGSPARKESGSDDDLPPAPSPPRISSIKDRLGNYIVEDSDSSLEEELIDDAVKSNVRDRLGEEVRRDVFLPESVAVSQSESDANFDVEGSSSPTLCPSEGWSDDDSSNLSPDVEPSAASFLNQVAKLSSSNPFLQPRPYQPNLSTHQCDYSDREQVRIYNIPLGVSPSLISALFTEIKPKRVRRINRTTAAVEFDTEEEAEEFIRLNRRVTCKNNVLLVERTVVDI